MENTSDKLITSLMMAFVGQMDAAIIIAKKVSEHSNEEGLSPDSLIAGLVYRLMTPMTTEEMTESLAVADDIINGEEDEDEDEDEDDYELGDGMYSPKSHDHGGIVIVSRQVKLNDCTCSLCQNVRKCLGDFKQHETNDKLSQMFKDAIQN